MSCGLRGRQRWAPSPHPILANPRTGSKVPCYKFSFASPQHHHLLAGPLNRGMPMRSLVLRLFSVCSMLAVAGAATSPVAQGRVTTQRYDAGRTGQNLSETVLNTTNV